MIGKGRVISTTVFSMKNQGYIQDLCLQFCELAVRPQHMKNIFRCGIFRFWRMQKETGSTVEITHRLIPVNRKHGEQGY